MSSCSNSHSVPESPELLRYNFNLMDKYDDDYIGIYLGWIETRGEAFKYDVDGILYSFRLQCNKFIRQHGCADSTSDAFPFDVMDGSRNTDRDHTWIEEWMDESRPTVDPNECIVAKIAR